MSKRKEVKWRYKNRVFNDIEKCPKGAFGFVYRIIDQNGKVYFGKKYLWFNRWQYIAKSTYDKLKAEDSKRKDIKRTKDKTKSKKGKGGTVWRHKQFKKTESDWKTYTGSCIPLNEQIDKGMDYKKEIVLFCYNKKQLSYFENKLLYCNDVLENPKDFYNDCISGKYYATDLIN